MESLIEGGEDILDLGSSLWEKIWNNKLLILIPVTAAIVVLVISISWKFKLAEERKKKIRKVLGGKVFNKLWSRFKF